MEEQVLQQLLVGGGAVVLGLSGWLLPYRWNVLRLKRFVASMFSEETQKLVPKILGTLLMAIGVAVLAGTAIIGKFQ